MSPEEFDRYWKENVESKPLTWDELLVCMIGDRTIIVTVINQLRKEEYYKTGRLTGFKCGIFGGGQKYKKRGRGFSYNSGDRHWVKKPKVHVTYGVLDYMKGREDSDWIDVDNCTFSIQEKPDLETF